jgi:hypothetical protein
VPCQLRQTEVEELGARPGQHDVARLQVAVHHALPVRGGEGLGDLRGDGQCLVQWQAALLEPRGERLAVQVLHHQKRRAVVFANVVERADVRVIQP